MQVVGSRARCPLTVKCSLPMLPLAEQCSRRARLGRAWLSCVAVCSVVLVSDASPQPKTASEYEIKAAFLYNFGKFVSWPAEELKDSEKRFVLCILGEDPFGEVMDQMVLGKPVQDRQLAVRRPKTAAETSGCNILFISQSERKEMSAVLQALDARSVLTVSEVDQFLELGGIINFQTDQNKIRFDINVTAAERGKLKISSQLLKLARRIVGRPSGD